MTDFDLLKSRHRRVWASGDYSQARRLIGHVGPDLLARLPVDTGTRLLDVATGTGITALPAARAGARVTGLDITPELLERARTDAEAEGLEIEWVQGDAEDLPFADGSFDVVASTFGVQFAPRHELTAAELARVCASGGRLGLASWTPASYIGRFLKTVGAHMPPPPVGASPPPLWGATEHVDELLGDAFELEYATGSADFTEATAESFVDDFATWYGPLHTAKAALSESGGWDALREELIALTQEFDRGDGSLRAPSEYLIVLGRRR